MQDPICKIMTAKRARAMVQMVEHLPDKASTGSEYKSPVTKKKN
jgi:hypothetical protein